MCSPQRSQVIFRCVVGGIVRGYHGRIIRDPAIKNDSSAIRRSVGGFVPFLEPFVPPKSQRWIEVITHENGRCRADKHSRSSAIDDR